MSLTTLLDWLAHVLSDAWTKVPPACPPPVISEKAAIKVSVSSYSWVEDLRQVVATFLLRCRIPYPRPPYDKAFHGQVVNTAIAKGYPMDGPHSLRPFIPAGVVMASTAYAHLPNREHRVYIALYTAILVFTDDIFQDDVEAVGRFIQHMTSGTPEPLAHPVLEAFASLLREMPFLFGRIESAMMLASTFNLVTALSLEHATRGIPVARSAQNYATWTRVLSGASETYGLFVFVGLPLQTFIQAVPDMMIFINNGNDVLSFYKEELAGETVNRISLLASCSGSTKMTAVRRVAEDACEAYTRVNSILTPHRDAHQAFLKFSVGYVGFHTGLKRYRLDELCKMQTR